MSLYLIVAFLLYQVYQVPLVKNLQGVLSEISRDFCVTIAFTQKIRKTEDNKILFNFTFFLFLMGILDRQILEQIHQNIRI